MIMAEVNKLSKQHWTLPCFGSPCSFILGFASADEAVSFCLETQVRMKQLHPADGHTAAILHL
jgi:hypothetical protein